MLATYAYGFPRLGAHREFKKLIEGYWQSTITEAELHQGIQAVVDTIQTTYQTYGITHPRGEMTLYDKMLDTALLLGVYEVNNLADYFALCRGKDCLEMTKWLNTNYHYLVPDLRHGFPFAAKPWSTVNRYTKLQQIDTDYPAYSIGPYTFVKLAKGIPANQFKQTVLTVAQRYIEVLQGIPAVHIDEPACVLDTSPAEQAIIAEAYQLLAAAGFDIRIFTYYEAVDWLPQLYQLPVQGLGLDMVHGDTLAQLVTQPFPANKTLYAGVVNGRNVFRTDLQATADRVRKLQQHVPNLMLTNAGPLFHLPVSIAHARLTQPVVQQLAFAQERLFELQTLAQLAADQPVSAVAEHWNVLAVSANPAVQQRVQQLQAQDFTKAVPYAQRSQQQQVLLQLPVLPTTTIGSYPQTADVRQQRAAVKTGKISPQEYQQYIEGKIKELIQLQEDLGLDVLVHGEYERSDMVEFFAEHLAGMATLQTGWIISYGTRCYRAPVIFGDVSRPHAMTVKEIAYAQSLTHQLVKGMLTGPITIIAWSFCREDIPTEHVAYQIALALQDEIRDYEAAGIKIVQVDEPAFREKAPLKRAQWPSYFAWATKAFRLTTNTKPVTQIHTHMCYSEFNEIIEYIQQMDFDVISIECSRSKSEMIEAFKQSAFDRQIGLGVWDIHSPAVPSVAEMTAIMRQSLHYIPIERFWINPDCGLKTRAWPETKAALANLITARQQIVEETSHAHL